VAAAPAPSGGTGFAFGIQAHLLEQDKQRIVDNIRGLNGFTWVKQQARWEELEPNPGQYNLDQLDQTVNMLSANGFKVLLSVVTAPRWARPGNTNFGVAGPPENPQTLANFMAFLAQRYKGKVQAYEVWNEQNIDGEWGYEPFSVDRYMSILKASYQAIKAVDRGILVISGALTPAGTVSFGGHDYAVDDLWYLEEMYKRGLKNYCDGVGIHPSGFAHPPNVTVDDMFAGRYAPKPGDTRTTHRSFYFKSTMLTYRNVMVVYGDSAKRLWPTEFGWASLDGLGVGPQPDREYYALNNQQEQASYIVEAFQWARDRGWVGPMFLWNLNFATCNDAANEKSGFGILMPDWSPRLAYAALAGMRK
jgi:hypothetical protein